MRGQSAGGISKHVVKLVGHNLLCSATVIGRQQLLTANHCVESAGPFFVIAGGPRIAVTGHTASGQTTLLTLASPLPANYVPISTGDARRRRQLHHRGLRHRARGRAHALRRPEGGAPRHRPALRRAGRSRSAAARSAPAPAWATVAARSRSSTASASCWSASWSACRTMRASAPAASSRISLPSAATARSPPRRPATTRQVSEPHAQPRRSAAKGKRSKWAAR